MTQHEEIVKGLYSSLAVAHGEAHRALRAYAENPGRPANVGYVYTSLAKCEGVHVVIRAVVSALEEEEGEA